MIGFKLWLEADTRPVVGVNDPKPQQYQLDSTQDLYYAITNFVNYINKSNFDNITTDADFAELLKQITNVSVKTNHFNTAAFFNNKQIQLPPNWQKTYEMFNFLKKSIDKLKPIINKYKKIYYSKGKNIGMVVYYMKKLEEVYKTVTHTFDAATGKSGNRFTGDYQQQANQISTEVGRVVFNVLSTGLNQLVQSQPKYTNALKGSFQIVVNNFKKPLAVSALQKEDVDNQTKENQHAEFIQGLRNLASLLQTPKIWRDPRYVERALFNTVGFTKHRPFLYKMNQKELPYKFKETIAAIQPVVKLLPNVVNHFDKNSMVHYYLKIFSEIWNGLKQAWHIGGDPSVYSNRMGAKLLQNNLPQMKQYIEDNLDKFFPNMGKNRNNYLKALNLYFNKIHGVLESI